MAPTEPGGLRGKDGLGLDQATEAGGLRNLDGLFPEPSNGGGGGTLYDPANWNSLIHYYALNGNGNDEVGSLDLTENGSPSYVSAVGGQGIALNGTDQYLNATGASDDFSSVSLSTWINPSALDSTEPILVLADSGGGTVVNLNIDGSGTGELRGAIGPFGSPIASASSTTTLSTNTKYHVALTYDGSNLQLYLNNSQDGSATGSGTLNTVTQSYVGTIQQSNFFGANYIDELMVFDSALTASEIDTLYQAGV